MEKVGVNPPFVRVNKRERPMNNNSFSRRKEYSTGIRDPPEGNGSKGQRHVSMSIGRLGDRSLELRDEP